jgi:hypothetical protein
MAELHEQVAVPAKPAPKRRSKKKVEPPQKEVDIDDLMAGLDDG